MFRSLSRLRGRDTHLGGSELSHAQFELLIELYERGELPAGELAAAARLTPATVTQMLEHLADCGHVERARSETDRRVVVSRLTPQGKRKIEAKRAAWQGRWEAALEGMEPASCTPRRACWSASARCSRMRPLPDLPRVRDGRTGEDRPKSSAIVGPALRLGAAVRAGPPRSQAIKMEISST